MTPLAPSPQLQQRRTAKSGDKVTFESPSLPCTIEFNGPCSRMNGFTPASTSPRRTIHHASDRAGLEERDEHVDTDGVRKSDIPCGNGNPGGGGTGGAA